jgi:hypothetical protein
MPVSECQKRANAKWRMNNHDKYKLYVSSYYNDRFSDKREIENIRIRKYRAYLKEAERFRAIAVFF